MGGEYGGVEMETSYAPFQTNHIVCMGDTGAGNRLFLKINLACIRRACIHTILNKWCISYKTLSDRVGKGTQTKQGIASLEGKLSSNLFAEPVKCECWMPALPFK